jgi:hypothetical protein
VAGGAPYIIYDDDDDPIGRWTGATAVAFTSDGQFFAYGRVDGTVVLARNPFGAPIRMAAQREGGAVRLNWRGGNRYYQVQRRNDLASGEWQNVGWFTTATNLLLSPGTEPAAFYRVQDLGN